MAIIRGTSQPVRTSIRRTYDPSKGVILTEQYESAGSNLNGLASAAKANQTEFDHTINDVRSRLALTYTGAAAGFGEDTVDTWQLLANQIQRDIKDHPTVLAFPQSGNGSLSQTLRFVEDFKEGTPPPDATDPENLGGFWTWDQYRLYRLLIHGVQSYTIDQHVVRHNLNVPLKYAGAITYSTIPGLLTTVLAGIAVNGPDDDVQFKWGWRRTGYQYSVTSSNRVEVATEWALASWSLLLYKSASITDKPV